MEREREEEERGDRCYAPQQLLQQVRTSQLPWASLNVREGLGWKGNKKWSNESEGKEERKGEKEMTDTVRRSRVQIKMVLWINFFRSRLSSLLQDPHFCRTSTSFPYRCGGMCFLLQTQKKMDHDKKVRSDSYMTCSCVHNMRWCMSESPSRQPFSVYVGDSYRHSSSINRLDQRGEGAEMA